MSEHRLIRATLVPEIARHIAQHFGISEDEALDRFYKSATAANLADDDTGFYGQSPLFLFGQYLEEIRGKDPLESNSPPAVFVDGSLPH